VGRIETEGMVLVDQKEAMSILGCSRATLWRRIKDESLYRIHVTGSRTVYVTLESVMRVKNPGPQFVLKDLESDEDLRRRAESLVKRFPRVFKQHRDLLVGRIPARDLLPSQEG
jgi:hypothetical protein